MRFEPLMGLFLAGTGAAARLNPACSLTGHVALGPPLQASGHPAQRGSTAQMEGSPARPMVSARDLTPALPSSSLRWPSEVVPEYRGRRDRAEVGGGSVTVRSNHEAASCVFSRSPYLLLVIPSQMKKLRH